MNVKCVVTYKPRHVNIYRQCLAMFLFTCRLYIPDHFIFTKVKWILRTYSHDLNWDKYFFMLYNIIYVINMCKLFMITVDTVDPSMIKGVMVDEA